MYRTLCVVTQCVFLLLVTVIPEQDAVSRGACPTGWHRWEDSCYKSYRQLEDWQEAVRRCHNLGGYLATPNSIDEYAFMWGIFRAQFNKSPGQGAWIGCTGGHDNNWKCTGDTPEVHYRAKWHKNREPASKCAVLSNRYLVWNDWPCSEVSKYVMCERRVNSGSTICSLVATDRCPLYNEYHTFKTLVVMKPLECCLACHKFSRCLSFNLRGNQCELKDVAYGEKHLAADNCTYYRSQAGTRPLCF